MNRFFRFTGAILVILMLSSLFSVSAFATETDSTAENVMNEVLSVPEISSLSACVLDVNTGEVVYAKNEHEQRPMASTTKIMTALLALESGNVGDDITITRDMLGATGTLLKLEEGWKITLYDLVVGAMVISGNDAADAIAVAVGGTKDNFVSMMNERAAELGMLNTHFDTPSGLDEYSDGAHYSTAYDMALLGAEASKNEDLISITSSLESIIYLGNPKVKRYLYPHNYLISTQKYEGCDGLKTGYTDRAGYCLVSHVERDGKNLVCVTLNGADRFNDHKKLYDYALSLYTTYNVDMSDARQTCYVIGGEEDSVTVSCTLEDFPVRTEYADNIEVKINTEKFIYAPIVEGEYLGSVQYINGNTVVKEFPLTAQESVSAVDESWLTAYIEAIKYKNGG